MVKDLPRKSPKLNDASRAYQKKQGSRSIIWTCSYNAERKLWIFKQVLKHIAQKD